MEANLRLWQVHQARTVATAALARNEVKHALEFLNPKFPKTQQARLFGTIPVGENDRQPNTLKVQTPSTDSKKNDKHDEKHDHADDHGHGAHHGVSIPIQNVARDLILIACGLISLFITPKSIREANGFTWGPINEVALLFLGIFATIIPALQILAAGDKGQLGWFIKMVDTPLIISGRRGFSRAALITRQLI